MRAILVVIPLLMGCPGETAAPPLDLSATPVDMTPLPDLMKADAADMGPLNCAQLNSCTTACTDQMCVNACRMRASMSAMMKEAAVQACFNTWCPQVADMGTAVCANRTSAACLTCVENTQKPNAMMCTPSAPECHQCLTQVAACVNDA